LTWLALSTSPVQYVDSNGDAYSGAVLKAYQSGTTTNINFSIDDAGGTTVTSVALNSAGYPSVSGNVVVLHVEEKYKLALYPTQAAADADSGAVWTVDELTAPVITGANTDINVKVSSNDTTAGYLNGKLVAGTNVALTEGSDGGNETLTVSALDSSTGLILDETADHVQTPAPTFGEIWVKDDAPNRLKYTDDDGNDSYISHPAQVAGHIRAGNTQLHDGDATISRIIIDSSVAKDTWETVGPANFAARGTAAADNLWADMDDIPASATILLVDIDLSLQANAAGSSTIVVYCAQGDIAAPAIDNNISRIGSYTMEAEAQFDVESIIIRTMIPLGPTNQDFHIYWTTQGSIASQEVDLMYRGFMTD